MLRIESTADGLKFGFWRHSRIDGWVWEGEGPVLFEEDSEDYLEGELPTSKRRVVDDILTELGLDL